MIKEKDGPIVYPTIKELESHSLAGLLAWLGYSKWKAEDPVRHKITTEMVYRYVEENRS